MVKVTVEVEERRRGGGWRGGVAVDGEAVWRWRWWRGSGGVAKGDGEGAENGCLGAGDGWGWGTCVRIVASEMPRLSAWLESSARIPMRSAPLTCTRAKTWGGLPWRACG